MSFAACLSLYVNTVACCIYNSQHTTNRDIAQCIADCISSHDDRAGRPAPGVLETEISQRYQSGGLGLSVRELPVVRADHVQLLAAAQFHSSQVFAVGTIAP